MNSPTLINGRIHSPFFIFIRCAGQYSDKQILQMLGVDGFHRSSSPANSMSCLYVTEDGQWLHVADDWYYSLWHMPTIRGAIAEIGKQHDVFACSVGESDHSYDFVYYSNGRLVRKFVVEDPHYRGGHVVVDEGTPIPGENEAMSIQDEQERVLFLAELLGIETRHDAASIRTYARARATSIR